MVLVEVVLLLDYQEQFVECMKPDKLTNKPKQSVFGFTDKFAKMMAENGGLSEPVKYGKTYTESMIL